MTGEEIDAIEMATVLVRLALNDREVVKALKDVTTDDISLFDQFECWLTEPAVQRILAMNEPRQIMSRNPEL